MQCFWLKKELIHPLEKDAIRITFNWNRFKGPSKTIRRYAKRLIRTLEFIM